MPGKTGGSFEITKVESDTSQRGIAATRKRIGETGRRETADGETEKIRWGDKLREISDQLSV